MANVTLTKSQKAVITRAINLLNKVRQEIQLENPDYDINWYLEDCGNLCLLENPSHDDTQKPRQDRVIEDRHLVESSGGAW